MDSETCQEMEPEAFLATDPEMVQETDESQCIYAKTIDIICLDHRWGMVVIAIF